MFVCAGALCDRAVVVCGVACDGDRRRDEGEESEELGIHVQVFERTVMLERSGMSCNTCLVSQRMERVKVQKKRPG